MKKIISFFTLFSSLSTLICCALPALFVAIGAGGALVSLFGQFPELIWLSRNKLFIFGFAGFMLLLGGILQKNAKKMACPVDRELKEVCLESKSFSQKIYILSLVIYFIGAFFAFIAPIIL